MRRLLIALFAVILSLAGCSWAEEQPPIPTGNNRSSSVEGEAEEEEEGPPPAQLMTITVPEGYTLARIAMLLEEKELCTVEEFLQAAQTGDYSHFPLVAAQEPDENRCFALEGYLFPDTYEIYSTDPPEVIIRKMLEHTEQKISQNLRSAIDKSGYTVDEILTLASIIEKEAFGPGEMTRISSVLHNRLEIGMQLQCDVTINYVEGAIKPFIDGDKDRYNDYYNTYKCAALPAGAICNPGIDAIYAALSPDDTDFYYFLTDQEDNYLYASTLSEHEENMRVAGLLPE